MSYQQHLRASRRVEVRCAIITVSDTRTLATDTSGGQIVEMLGAASHETIDHQIVKDEPDQLQAAIDALLLRENVDAIFTTGGTGISRRDQTINIIERQIEQPLPGFGELFRFLSFEQIGSGAMLSRALAGIIKGKLIFCMPGSTAAVELAMSRLILPELQHLVHELKK